MAVESTTSTGRPIPSPDGLVPNGYGNSGTKDQTMEKPFVSTTNGIPDQGLAFDSIEDSIAAFSMKFPVYNFSPRNTRLSDTQSGQGCFIIVLDAPARENEGDLMCPAQDFTPEKAAFMIRHTSGLICCPVSPSIASDLCLPQMVPLNKNSEMDGAAYTVSVDAIDAGITTGISAHDRAMTCCKLSSPDARPLDFRRPGHIFPLRAREGGVRERSGHTEATLEFCRLAGKSEVGAICELVEEGEELPSIEDGVVRMERTVPNGGMLRGEKCLAFGRRWGIKVCTIKALVEYLDEHEKKR
ncbi:MAG: hypothetical protein LQ338_005759 [Usnochroma carphineum]|nr:MAG: hypothetical protein LQ338_005759 [Usnochroma carphineum]